jgi:hypothetical protein
MFKKWLSPKRSQPRIDTAMFDRVQEKLIQQELLLLRPQPVARRIPPISIEEWRENNRLVAEYFNHRAA